MRLGRVAGRAAEIRLLHFFDLYGAPASLATEPWLAIFPGVFIFWIVLSVNLVGDGLSFRGRL